jgi:hypothetical protein
MFTVQIPINWLFKSRLDHPLFSWFNPVLHWKISRDNPMFGRTPKLRLRNVYVHPLHPTEWIYHDISIWVNEIIFHQAESG